MCKGGTVVFQKNVVVQEVKKTNKRMGTRPSLYSMQEEGAWVAQGVYLCPGPRYTLGLDGLDGCVVWDCAKGSREKESMGHNGHGLPDTR